MSHDFVLGMLNIEYIWRSTWEASTTRRAPSQAARERETYECLEMI